MASSTYLRSQRREKIKKRDILVKRKEEVDNIILRISLCLDEEISNLNGMITTTELSLSNGLKGKAKNIAEEIGKEKEKYHISDSKISSCSTKLKDESSRCQNRIDITNQEIVELDSRIRRAEQREAEERRAMVEYWASLTGGGSR